MHVGLNLVFLVPGETGGMETHARELIPRLAALDGVRVTAFVNREAAQSPGPWGDVVPMEVVPVNARSRVQWVRGEQQYLPRMADRAACDVVHSLASTAPLRGRARRVTTIHDLNYKLVPHTHFGVRGLGMRVLVPAAARRSHRLMVDAGSTRRDLCEYLGTAPTKIDVVPLGVSGPAAAPTAESELRERLNLGSRPVALSVSAKRPHKNLARLLSALALIPAAERPMLVVPGYPTPYEQELRVQAATLSVGDVVVFPAWLSAEDLEGLYAIARLAVFPSLYEGFGLPVLDAMTRGVPVACSDSSSLPEVAGKAALLFDPHDTAAMAAAIERLMTDAAERERLRALGSQRVTEFTWERTAQLTLESYERALAPSSA